MAHGQWTEIEARGMLTALAKSGLSVTAFARDRGITPQRIYWWKAKLGSNETKVRDTKRHIMDTLAHELYHVVYDMQLGDGRDTKAEWDEEEERCKYFGGIVHRQTAWGRF